MSMLDPNRKKRNPYTTVFNQRDGYYAVKRTWVGPIVLATSPVWVSWLVLWLFG